MSPGSAAIAVLISTCTFAQAHFEVASVRPSNLTGEGSRRENITADPGGVILRNVTLGSAIQWAYGVNDYQVSGPAWLKDSRYDISAKTAQPASYKQQREMMKALLADRFKLTLHYQEKEMTVYALTVTKSGLKMTPGDPDGKSALQGNGFTLTAKDTPISEIVENLSRAGRGFPGMDVPPVVDMTGLTGRYNFTIDASTFMQEFAAEAQKATPDPSVLIAGVQDVLEKQLGLHSELRKAKIDILIVDHAEQSPTGN
jgi:uncharacterized protein (TIGR03435 family)